MALRATHVPSGTDIAIGPFMDPISQAIVDEVFQGCGEGILECREHDNDPRLAHLRDERGRVHGAWVYLQYRNRRTLLVMAHHPNGTGREFKFHPHLTPTGKSDDHRWQQDYICRAADDVDFPSDQEDWNSVPGTGLDVRIDGPVGPVGFEVQHSFLGVPEVRARTRKAAKVGIPLVWCADKKGPDWAFKVPHVEANEGVPGSSAPRGSWTVTTGPRRIVRLKCEPSNADRLLPCRKAGRGRAWCGGYHAVFEPVYGLNVDDIVQMVPAGNLVTLDTGLKKQGVILTPAEDYDLWMNEFAGQVEQRGRERNNARPCSYTPQLHAPEGMDRAVLLSHPRAGRSCSVCGEPLPRAAIHIAAHHDCRNPTPGAA